jgi:hypothetical protein
LRGFVVVLRRRISTHSTGTIWRELVAWHEDKQEDVEHADQFEEGSSSSSTQTCTSVGLPTLGLLERGYLHSKNG